MATKAPSSAVAEKKPHGVKKTLGKRIELAQGNEKLNRDVKIPRWLKASGSYFTDSWHELRQVRWPNRRATIRFTSAVILFTLGMSAFILALDYVFQLLFKQVILK